MKIHLDLGFHGKAVLTRDSETGELIWESENSRTSIILKELTPRWRASVGVHDTPYSFLVNVQISIAEKAAKELKGKITQIEGLKEESENVKPLPPGYVH